MKQEERDHVRLQFAIAALMGSIAHDGFPQAAKCYKLITNCFRLGTEAVQYAEYLEREGAINGDPHENG